MSAQKSPEMNPDTMYLEEVFTDQAVGQIRRMTPVTADGQTDPARLTLYVGYTQVMTQGGAMPLNFQIDAGTLSEAISSFSAGAEKAMIDTMKELEELRREQASSIVVPGQQGSGIQIP